MWSGEISEEMLPDVAEETLPKGRYRRDVAEETLPKRRALQDEAEPLHIDTFCPSA